MDVYSLSAGSGSGMKARGAAPPTPSGMKRGLRRWLTPIVVALVLSFICFPAAQGAYNPAVYIDDVPLQCDEAPVILDNTTYVPLRAFAGYFGREVSWDNSSRTACVEMDGFCAMVYEMPGTIEANGRCLYAAAGIRNINGRLMLPVRIAAGLFGAEVKWAAETREVYITSGIDSFKCCCETYDCDELYWLSRIISAESAGEPLEGQIAVGNVIINRMNSEQFPNSMYGVIFDDEYGVQFEPVANGTIYNEPSEQSVKAAKICLEGTNVIGESMYFFNPRIAQSFWIEKNRSFHATIGNHDFYN